VTLRRSRTSRWLACGGGALALALAVGLASCKDRGTVTFDLTFPDACPATHVQAYLIRNVTCGECSCAECVAPCNESNCEPACPQPCPIDVLDDGLAIQPTEPGLYAVVYQLIDTPEDGGLPRLVASACADAQVDEDGTTSMTLDVAGECCAPTDLDAGFAAHETASLAGRRPLHWYLWTRGPGCSSSAGGSGSYAR
jgi:hypothetical protein